jgi:hypothetical protein
MANKHKAEHRLIPEGSYHRCSACGYPFAADVYPSLSVAFTEHLENAHKPGQTSEGVNQGAAESTRDTKRRSGPNAS